ncbi:MAG: C39 family peptidase [Clostridia bacterium]|nr:C39 family peptidase [Clostridia bacterium]MBQ7048152.1 C39 family peptidase [Clostridia bacterium]
MGIKIRNASAKLFCIILCWALMVVPCGYFVWQDFNMPVAGDVTASVPTIAPSAPTGELVPMGNVLNNNDLPEQDLFANSDYTLSTPADKNLASIDLNSLYMAAGKAPALYVPPVVVPQEPSVPENDDDTEATPDIDTDADVNGDGSAGFYGSYAILKQNDGSSFIYYEQTWDAYTSHPYGNATIGGYGCGPTSMAMVVSNLTDYVITPDKMGDWSASHGYFVSGRGTAYGLFPAVSAMYGINCTTISSYDKNAVVSALKQGKLLLTVVSYGDFTMGRHFLLIRGITDDGKLLLADSGKYENCLTEWDYDRVIRQISGGQFWVFSK